MTAGRNRRLERAKRAEDPAQRQAAARRAMKQAVHKLGEVETLIRGAADVVVGIGVPLSAADLIMDAGAVARIKSSASTHLNVLEGL